MRKKYAIFILFAFVLLLNSCETTNCIVRGTCYTAEGISKDIKNFPRDIKNLPNNIKNFPHNLWQGLLKTDSWLRENLW